MYVGLNFIANLSQFLYNCGHMSERLPLLRQVLRARGHSVTKSRELIFITLDTSGPLTLADLTKRVTPHTDRASVYRTISLFEQLGIVHRVQIGWKYKLELSDEFQAHHHHISCLRCGQMVSIKEHTEIEAVISHQSKELGFELVSHQLELQGICQNCQKHETPTVLSGSNGSLTLPIS